MNFFKVLFALIKKDLKLFFRSRVSSILALLIPLLVVLSVGYAFNSPGISNIHVGVYQANSSNFSETMISKFGSEKYLVENFNSLDKCVSSVELGQIQICSYFYLNSSKKDSVTFYVDYSRMNLVEGLVNSVKKSAGQEANSLALSSTENLVNLINITRKDLPDGLNSLDEGSKNISESSDVLGSVNIPLSSFSTLLSYLENAKSNSNNTQVISKIDSSILLVKEIQSSNNLSASNVKSSYVLQKDGLNKINVALFGLKNLETSILQNNIKSANEIVSPVDVNVESVNTNSKNRDYLILILLSVIILFGSILLSSTFVMKEKKTKAYFRNFMTPTKDGMFILSTYISCLILISVQLILAIIGLKYILDMAFFVFSFELLSILFLAVSAFIFIGMFIGYLFRSEETVIFASMIVATVFVFFSNTVLPLENISSNLFRFSFLNPLVSLNSSLKKILFFGFSFSSIYTEIIVFGGFILVFLALSYVFRRLTRRVL